MKKTKTQQRRSIVRLTEEQMRQWRKDRDLIADELPNLIAKHERICKAAEERTTSGALRRAIHSSKILLHDLARRAKTEMKTLDAFLTGEQPLTSDVIDRLTMILNLDLRAADSKVKPRKAKAS